MGRQFRFYILPMDANALISQLRGRFSICVLVDYSPEHELFEVELPYRGNPLGELEPISPQLRYYLVPSSGNIIRRYCAKPNWWVIDSDSEGIEFSSCRIHGNALIEGRFWHGREFVRESQFVKKSPEFLKWADAVYRLSKKLLHYDPSIEAYVGEQATTFRNSGGQFTPFIREDGKTISA
jgi:hypothetical protein